MLHVVEQKPQQRQLAKTFDVMDVLEELVSMRHFVFACFPVFYLGLHN